MLSVMRTEFDPYVMRRTPPTPVTAAAAAANKTRRDMEAALAIAELSGGRLTTSSPGSDVTGDVNAPRSTVDDVAGFPVRFSHIKTAVMPARHSHVQKVLKRKIEERNMEFMEQLNAGGRGWESPDCGADPLKRAIEMERDNFLTVKRQRSFVAEEPVKEEAVGGKFVRCCMPSNIDLKAKFGGYEVSIDGSLPKGRIEGPEMPAEPGTADMQAAEENTKEEAWSCDEVRRPLFPLASRLASSNMLQKSYPESDSRIRAPWMMPPAEETPRVVMEPGRHGWRQSQRETASPSAYSSQATGIDGCIAMVNNQLANGSVVMDQQQRQGQLGNSHASALNTHYYHSRNNPPSVVETYRPENPEAKFGALGSLSDYYYLGQTAARSVAKSHFLPYGTSPVRSEVQVPAPSSRTSRVLQTVNRCGVETGMLQQRHHANSFFSSHRRSCRTVDNGTATKVKSGDFGSLHTLRDYYHQFARPRSGRGSRIMKQGHRRSWPNHDMTSPMAEQPPMSSHPWREDLGCSDDEAVIDLSLHKNRNLEELNIPEEVASSDWLRPDVYAFKSKSCGSSPIPSQFVVYHSRDGRNIAESVELYNVSDSSRQFQAYGSMAIRSSPAPPLSPPALNAINKDYSALTTTDISPAIPTLEISPPTNVEEDHKSHVPDSRLPLKKRRIHEETVAEEDLDPTSHNSGINDAAAVADNRTSASRAVLIPDEDGDLPLHIAVVHEELSVVGNLIHDMSTLGASLDTYNKLKQTPLHLAVLTCNIDIVRALINAGASPNAVDRKGLTCVHHAAQLTSVNSLRCLLEESTVAPNIDALTYDGLTALHLAVRHGNIGAVDVLLRAGAQIDACDGKNGRTALFYAVERDDTQIAALLLKRGANPAVTTYSGCTPVQVATTTRCSTELLHLLESYDACAARQQVPCYMAG